jgi:hypothetical protein
LYKTFSNYTELYTTLHNSKQLVHKEYHQKYKETIKRLSNKYNFILLEPKKNLGLKQGGIWALDQIKFKEDDKIMFYDSNCYPLTKNFDKALFDIIDGENIIASLLTLQEHNELEKFKDKITGYLYYNFIDSLAMSSVVTFMYSLHLVVKGTNVHNYSNNYGDGFNLPISKIKINKILSELNKKAVFLCDFHESFTYLKKYEDNLYILYKKLMNKRSTYKDITFEDYIINYKLYNQLSKSNDNVRLFSGENSF